MMMIITINNNIIKLWFYSHLTYAFKRKSKDFKKCALIELSSFYARNSFVFSFLFFFYFSFEKSNKNIYDIMQYDVLYKNVYKL